MASGRALWLGTREGVYMQGRDGASGGRLEGIMCWYEGGCVCAREGVGGCGGGESIAAGSERAPEGVLRRGAAPLSRVPCPSVLGHSSAAKTGRKHS